MTPTEYLEENNNELKLKLEKNLLRNKVTKEMMDFAKEYHTQQLILSGVIERYSGENLMKLQKHFVSIYGSDEMAQEKANSFAVGFGKACELIIKDLNAL